MEVDSVLESMRTKGPAGRSQVNQVYGDKVESSSLKELKEMAAALQKPEERLAMMEKRNNRKKDFNKKEVTATIVARRVTSRESVAPHPKNRVTKEGSKTPGRVSQKP